MTNSCPTRRSSDRDAVLQDIVLLPHAIDEDVDAAAVLRAALQARLPVAAGDELHARREIGEGEEVAIILWQHLYLALADVRSEDRKSTRLNSSHYCAFRMLTSG